MVFFFFEKFWRAFFGLSIILCVSVLNSAEIDELWYCNLAAGITKVEMVMNQIKMNTFALILMNCTIVISTLTIFDISIPVGNGIHFALLVILMTLSAQYTGFFLVTLCNSYSILTHLFNTVTCIIAYVCGNYSKSFLWEESHLKFYNLGSNWPVEGQPFLLKTISSSIPLTKCIAAFRSLLFKKVGDLPSVVKEAYIGCTIWILLSISLSIILIKFRYRN